MLWVGVLWKFYLEWILCLYVCVWKLLFLNGLLFLNEMWYMQPTHDIIFSLEFISGGGGSWDWAHWSIVYLATSDLRWHREWQGFSELWKVSSTGVVLIILFFTIPSLFCVRDICLNELNKITDQMAYTVSAIVWLLCICDFQFFYLFMSSNSIRSV